MNVKMAFPLPLLAMLTLCLVVALSSCSKKDVVQDEPLMSPAEAGLDSGQAVAPEQSVGTEGAGDASAASDLSDIFFAFDSFALNGEARGVLKRHADWLRSNPKATIQVEGHCDERGTTEYNLALGERRANAALDYLLKVGISRSRLSTVSYGEERPLDPGHDESAWARNRRASFIVTSR